MPKPLTRLTVTQNKVISWLLEEEQPSVRYYALTQLLDRSENDSEVKEARSLIPKRGWAASILQRQRADGFWESPENLMRPKYKASNWQLLVLSDLGVTASDPRVMKIVDHLFSQRYNRQDGGFGLFRKDQSLASHFCLTGNTARMLTRFGLGNDSRVKSAFDWLVEHQLSDGGWNCFSTRRGTLDCWEALAAYASIHPQKWTRKMKNSVEQGAEFYLKNELWREGKKRYEPWFRFHYPWHYYYDILLGLDVLTALGYTDDPRLTTALNLLKQKRRSNGKWILDAVHPDIALPDSKYLDADAKPLIIEKPGEPSKWLTLLGLRIMKRVERNLPAR